MYVATSCLLAFRSVVCLFVPENKHNRKYETRFIHIIQHTAKKRKPGIFWEVVSVHGFILMRPSNTYCKGTSSRSIERHASRRDPFLRRGTRSLLYLIQLYLLGFSSTYNVHKLGFTEYLKEMKNVKTFADCARKI